MIIVFWMLAQWEPLSRMYKALGLSPAAWYEQTDKYNCFKVHSTVGLIRLKVFIS